MQRWFAWVYMCACGGTACAPTTDSLDTEEAVDPGPPGGCVEGDVGPQGTCAGPQGGPVLVRDMTGDGIHDLLVTVDIESQTYVVPGPFLGRSEIDFVAEATGIVQHEDAWAIVCTTAADVDGDGLTDIVTRVCSCHYSWDGASSGYPHKVVLAPIEGVRLAGRELAYDGSPIDLDGDGAFERVRRDGSTFQIFDVVSELPFLVIKLPSDQWVPLRVVPYPDLDGDGERDVLVEARLDTEVHSFWIDADAQGAVALTLDRGRHSHRVHVVGDQTGDGMVDGFPSIRSDAAGLMVGPFDLSGVHPIAARTHPPIPWPTDMGRLPFDLDGDGRGEFARISGGDYLSPSVVSVVSYRDGVEIPLLEISGDDAPSFAEFAFGVEDGRGVAIVVNTSSAWVRTVNVHHLGPATPMDPQE